VSLSLNTGFVPINKNQISLRSQVYHSEDYSRVRVRNSYTVKYMGNSGKSSYGYICWYALHISDSKEETPVCCIRKLEYTRVKQFGQPSENTSIDNFLGLSLKHINVLSNDTSNTFEIICVENILFICICICVEQNAYVCEEPNPYESKSNYHDTKKFYNIPVLFKFISDFI